MARFTTTMTVWHGGKAHLAGEGISLTASEAEPLLDMGAIEPAGRAEKAQSAEEKAAADKAADDAALAVIEAALAAENPAA